MAYDSKRLKTFKWFEDLALCKNRYDKGNLPRFENIMIRFGSLYATDGIILAKIDYPEFEHIGDDYWLDIISFLDDKAYALKYPVTKVRERQFLDDRVFDKHFDDEFSPLEASIDPRVLKCGLKAFEINNVFPVVYTSENKVYLMGHNEDVSIRVVTMGTR